MSKHKLFSYRVMVAHRYVISMGGEYLAIGPRSNRCIDILPSMKVSITMRLIYHDESIDILIGFHRRKRCYFNKIVYGSNEQWKMRPHRKTMTPPTLSMSSCSGDGDQSSNPFEGTHFIHNYDSKYPRLCVYSWLLIMGAYVASWGAV